MRKKRQKSGTSGSVHGTYNLIRKVGEGLEDLLGPTEEAMEGYDGNTGEVQGSVVAG